MIPYDDLRRELENEGCRALNNHPSSWWNHPVIGDFFIDASNGYVSDWEYSLIMNDIIKNRP